MVTGFRWKLRRSWWWFKSELMVDNIVALVGVVMVVPKQVEDNAQQIRDLLVAGCMEVLDMVAMLRLLDLVVPILLEAEAVGMEVVLQK